MAERLAMDDQVMELIKQVGILSGSLSAYTNAHDNVHRSEDNTWKEQRLVNEKLIEAHSKVNTNIEKLTTTVNNYIQAHSKIHEMINSDKKEQGKINNRIITIYIGAITVIGMIHLFVMLNGVFNWIK